MPVQIEIENFRGIVFLKVLKHVLGEYNILCRISEVNITFFVALVIDFFFTFLLSCPSEQRGLWVKCVCLANPSHYLVLTLKGDGLCMCVRTPH